MTPMLSVNISMFSLVLFVLSSKSLLGIAIQRSHEQLANFDPKSLGVLLEFLIYRMWAIMIQCHVFVNLVTYLSVLTFRNLHYMH